jgi:nucleoside-diphosphate-sugar epimerase
VSYPDIASRIPDITAARHDLGYEPAVALEEGLQRTIAWYRRQSRAAAAR